MAADKLLSLLCPKLTSFFSSCQRFFKKRKVVLVEHSGLWEELNVDIMEKIISYLDVKSVSSVKSVCKSWQGLFNEPGFKTPRKNPWLLFPQSHSFSTSLKFYDMFGPGNDIFSISIPEPLRGGQVCGSSKGWLLVLTRFDLFLLDHLIGMYLFDPLSGQQHRLPPLPFSGGFDYGAKDFYKIASMCIDRIELSSRDLSECVVAVIIGCGSYLACCKPKYELWTIFEDPIRQRGYSSISLCDKTLYVITHEPTVQSLKKDFKVVAESLIMKLNGGNDDDDDDECSMITLKLLPGFTERNSTPTQNYANLRIQCGGTVDYLRESNKNDGVLFLVRKYMINIYAVEEEEDGNNDVIEEDGHEHENEDVIEEAAHDPEHGDHVAALEEDDEIVVVEEERDEHGLICDKTESFNLFELIPCKDDSTVNSYSVKRVESLDDIQDAVFVGRGSTFIHSFDTNLIRKGGNRIYYTDDGNPVGNVGSRETGVFQISEEKLKQCLPSIDLPAHSYMYWFTPNLSF